MPRTTRTRFAHTATLLLFTTAFTIALRADEFTGTPGSDPKDLLVCAPSGPPPVAPADAIQFAPMPRWAQGVLMPPLPACLTPMGKSKMIAKNNQKPPLEPPKDPKDVTADGSNAATPAVSTPGPKPVSDPAFITVSPFLQWVQANPQAAAEQARQQAGAYQPPPAPTPNTPSGPLPPNGANANGAPQPYWLPPLIDSSNVMSAGSVPVTGSSAIYTRPAR